MGIVIFEKCTLKIHFGYFYGNKIGVLKPNSFYFGVEFLKPTPFTLGLCSQTNSFKMDKSPKLQANLLF